ncbi:hypothetical protein [Afipia felis]|nr:hypothetical protein [Afipia felis]
MKTTTKTTSKAADFAPMIEIRGSLAPFELVKKQGAGGKHQGGPVFLQCGAERLTTH